MNHGFVIDTRSCIGCHACSTACKSENQVPLGVNRTWVKYTEVGQYPDVERQFQVTRCNHCENPPCVSICPVSAMYQRDDGIVEFDGDACIGCKACLQACPYDAIYIDPETKTAAKCHYCGHRVEVGLEPACVVVCPTHSIISGDLDDPESEISRVVAAHETEVRKPEQNTKPNVFYVDGIDVSLNPAALDPAASQLLFTDRVDPHTGAVAPGYVDAPIDGPVQFTTERAAEQMVQVAYNAQHRVPWHWQVPAYLVTKGMGAGIFGLLSMMVLLGQDIGTTMFLPGLLGLIMTGVTTALLVGDLEHPLRFLRILTRPQWRSWLTRGAFILVGFSTITALWWVGEAMGWAAPARMGFAAVTLPLAIGTANYTALLFGQCEGRDLWQSRWLLIQLILEAVALGGAGFVLMGLVSGDDPTTMITLGTQALTWGLAAHLVGLAIEYGPEGGTTTHRQARNAILRGRWASWFWGGGVAMGHLVPLAILFAIPTLAPLAALLCIAGLYCAQHAFVMAPQDVPNS